MKKYTAADYRKFISDVIEEIDDVTYLRKIFSLIVIKYRGRKSTGD